MTAVILFMFFLYFCVRLGESEAGSHCLRTLFGKFAQRPLVEKLFILVFVVMMVAHGGSKTNSVPQGGGGNIVVVVDPGTVRGRRRDRGADRRRRNCFADRSGIAAPHQQTSTRRDSRWCAC